MKFIKIIFIFIMFAMSIGCGVSEKSEDVGIIGGCYQSKDFNTYYFCIAYYDDENKFFNGTYYILEENKFNNVNGNGVSRFSKSYIKTMFFIGMKTDFIEKIKKDNENIFKIGYCYVQDYDKDENPFKNKPKTPESLLCVKDKKNGYLLLDIYFKDDNKWYKREDSSHINYYAGWFDKEYGLKKDIFPDSCSKVKK